MWSKIVTTLNNNETKSNVKKSFHGAFKLTDIPLENQGTESQGSRLFLLHAKRMTDSLFFY